MAEKLPRGISVAYRTRAGQQLKLYQVRITWKGRRELVGRFETLRDAKQAQIMAQADVLRGQFIPPRQIRAALRAEEQAAIDAHRNRYTVAQLADDWLAHLRRIGRKESTIYTYRRLLDGRILPHFEGFAADSVTPQEIEEWFDKLDAEHGRGVSRGAYMALASMYNYAAGNSKGLSADFEPIVERSPCRISGATEHKPVRPATASDKVIDEHQIGAIAQHMPAATQLAVLISGHMALRIGEVLGLQRHDVTHSDGDAWLRVERQLQSRGQGLQFDTPKSAAGKRELPIPPGLQPIVVRHLEQHVAAADDAPLFPRQSKGDEPIHPNVVRKHFKAAITAANEALSAGKQQLVPAGFVFHGLRHSALTRVGQSGATEEELKVWAGHNDSKSVERYQHATRNRLKALAAKQSVSIKLTSVS